MNQLLQNFIDQLHAADSEPEFKDAMTVAAEALGLPRFVTLTGLRVERLAKAAGWPFERISEPQRIDNVRAVAILLEVSKDALFRVQQAGELKGPILWEPVLLEKAA